MEKIQRYRLAEAERDECSDDGLVADTEGFLVKYADHLERVRVLREALEVAAQYSYAWPSADAEKVRAALKEVPDGE